jgi:hypothetical protein
MPKRKRNLKPLNDAAGQSGREQIDAKLTGESR